MKKGLAALLFASTVYAGDFAEELKILDQKAKISHCTTCDVHVRVKEVIDKDVKEHYEKVSQRPWYDEVDALNKVVQENYCKNFKICIEIVAVKDWPHEKSYTLETLIQEAFFVPMENADVVVGLTGMDTFYASLLTGSIGKTELKGNYSLVSIDNDATLIFVHEFAHLFGALDLDDKDSLMYKKAIGSLRWDKKSKEIILANKYRTWELPEARVGLHELARRLDEQSLRQLKMIYRALGLQSLVSDKRKLWQQAAVGVENIIVDYPKEGYLHFITGQLYEKLEHGEQAIPAYEKALEYGIQYAILYNNLAWFYAEKKPEKAIVLAQKAVTKEPKTEEFRETLGWAYYNNEKYAEAEQELVGLKTLENNAEYLYHLGLTYDKRNKHDKAKDAFQKVTALDKGTFKVLAQEKLKEYRKR